MHRGHLQQILKVKGLADALPVAERIEMYLWLGNIAGDPWTTRQFNQLATDLQRSSDISRELELKLQTPPAGDGNGGGR